MNRCWVLVADVPTPNNELDYWVYQDAVDAYHRLCTTYPFAEITLYEVTDYDEFTEKRKIDRRQEATW